jgi:hypothetical protein
VFEFIMAIEFIPNLLLVFITASLVLFLEQGSTFLVLLHQPAVDFYDTKQYTTIIDLLAGFVVIVLVRECLISLPQLLVLGSEAQVLVPHFAKRQRSGVLVG